MKAITLNVVILLLSACALKMKKEETNNNLFIKPTVGRIELLSDKRMPSLSELDKALKGFSRVRTRSVKARYEYFSKNGYRAQIVASSIARKINEKSIDEIISDPDQERNPKQLTMKDIPIFIRSCTIFSPLDEIVFSEEWGH